MSLVSISINLQNQQYRYLETEETLTWAKDTTKKRRTITIDSIDTFGQLIRFQVVSEIFHHGAKNRCGNLSFLFSVVIVECISNFGDLVVGQLKFLFFFSLDETKTRRWTDSFNVRSICVEKRRRGLDTRSPWWDICCWVVEKRTYELADIYLMLSSEQTLQARRKRKRERESRKRRRREIGGTALFVSYK